MGLYKELIIESKSFTLVKEGNMLGITERSRRVVSKLVLGSTTVKWLAKAMTVCTNEKRDFYSTVREGRRTFTAHRCSNPRGRYMAVEEYGGGGRRNFIFIPEEGGNGWRRMGELLHDFSSPVDGQRDVGGGPVSPNQMQKGYSKHVGGAEESLEEKDPSTSSVSRRSYATALKTGHASGVQNGGGLQIIPQDPLVEMHNSLKDMETQLVELKAAITCLSTKIDLLSAGDNRVVRNKTSPNPLNKGKRKIGFGPVPITRSRRVWRVKRKSGLFEVGSTSGIGVETSVMECHSPLVTPLVPEETMAPSSELNENGVLLRSERDVEFDTTPEVKELAVTPESRMGLERTDGVAGEPMSLALVPCIEELPESGVQLDTVSGDNFSPLVSLPPIADWILPKVSEIQQFVGISHGGCENQFKELITAIEASHVLETKSSFKKNRELQRLHWAINYDTKSGSSSRGKSKGRTS